MRYLPQFYLELWAFKNCVMTDEFISDTSVVAYVNFDLLSNMSFKTNLNLKYPVEIL